MDRRFSLPLFAFLLRICCVLGAHESSAWADARVVKFGFQVNNFKASETLQRGNGIIKCLNDELKNLGKEIKVELEFAKIDDSNKNASPYQPLVDGKVDFMSVNPFDYVLLKKTHPKLTPIVVGKKNGKPYGEGLIITHDKSGLDSLSDLSKFKGESRKVLVDTPAREGEKTTAFAAILASKGVTSNDFKKTVRFPRWDQGVGLIFSGEADLYVFPKVEYEKQKQKNPEKFKNIKVIDSYQRMNQPLVVAKPGIDKGVFQALRDAYLKIQGNECVGDITVEGFMSINDGDFGTIQKIIEAADKF